ncbi:hypothetical protein ARHIZOSPH14_06280 [Agromyces rhizosphaerae]|uniref:NTP pyrophosphohydrolase n=1 Tax=Agromyces rhizosphaerae TaxID=88374 RepID=A0A9W6FND5_9MICO|nr:hypothetical protein [Agromyces rhizosphaerae]GLI26386.1 hypothetical protein ARHIZOSPH14_06280 [Agromyces rhizosphaerae]
MSAEVAPDAVVVVDVANVMGARPDGWWRDRAGAAARLLAGMPGLVGDVVEVHGTDAPEPTQPGTARIARIVAVVEGQAKAVADVEGIDVVRAPADGDGAIVEVAGGLVASAALTVVVTADRGLRARLDDEVRTVGPRWIRDLLDA